jgi:uncharacterized protein (TIGR03085 family)
MRHTPPVRSERLRQSLAELLLEVGPDAPTLCTGWNARDLAAHLVAREHRIDALPGIALPPLAAHTEHVQADIARRPFVEVVDTFAAGPALISPFRIPAIREAANVAEFSIHREDIKRAVPGWTPQLTWDRDADALWQRLRTMGRLALRRSPVGVLAVRTDAPGQVRLVNRPGQVVLRGTPLELLMRATGRTASVVEIHGTSANIAAFERGRFTI